MSTTDEVTFVEGQLSSLLSTARQRLQHQVEQERAIINLLNVQGSSESSFEAKSAAVAERIRENRRLDECIARFKGYIESEEAKFGAAQQQLRFPLTLLEELVSNAKWGECAEDQGLQDDSMGGSHSGLYSSKLAVDAPNFVRALESSKSIHRVVTQIGELQFLSFNDKLTASHVEAKKLTSAAAAVTAKVTQSESVQADLEQQIHDAELALFQSTDFHRRWSEMLAVNDTYRAIIAITDRTVWLETMRDQIENYEKQCQSIEKKISFLESQREKFTAAADDAISSSARIAGERRNLEERKNKLSSTLESLEKTIPQQAALPNEAAAEKETLLKTLRTEEALFEAELQRVASIREKLHSFEKQLQDSERKRQAYEEGLNSKYQALQEQAEERKHLSADIAQIQNEVELATAQEEKLNTELSYLASLHPSIAAKPPDTTRASACLSKELLLARAREARKQFRQGHGGTWPSSSGSVTQDKPTVSDAHGAPVPSLSYQAPPADSFTQRVEGVLSRH